MKRFRKKLIYSALLITLLIILLSIASFLLFAIYFNVEKISNKELNLNIIPREEKSLESVENYSAVEIFLPSITSDNRGEMTKVYVEARKGSGKILVDVENLLFWIDTQYSIRVAKKVAEKYLNKSLDDVDLIYSIKANATIVEGPSAGAALAIATIAVLEKKEIKKDVAVTGTINLDGTIGQVGGILEKGMIAKEFGIKTFIVPKGQRKILRYETERSCKRVGLITYCEIITRPIEVDVGKELGINVIEVGHIIELINYLLK